MFEVGQKVVSYKIGAVPGFLGTISVMVGAEYRDKFAVIVDDIGRSFYRDFNEIRPATPDDL